jgi:beta-N-acetylhexosaminidase
VCALLLTVGEPAQARNNHSTDELKRSIGQMIITGFSGNDATAPDFQRVLNNLQDGVIGGVLFLPANIASREQLQTMIKMIRSCACRTPPLIAVDEEGGVVERLGEQIGFAQTRSAEDIARDGPAVAKAEYKQVAHKLSDLGFNLNLAPVVDLNTIRTIQLSSRIIFSPP